MPQEYSPFTPDQPVPVEFFVGRTEQIKWLLEKVGAAASGRLQTAFLYGERGIGKSSLASFVRRLAERDHQVVGVHAHLGPVTNLPDMVRQIINTLVNESLEKTWHKKLINFFGDRVKKVGLWGASLEIDASAKDLQNTVDNFAVALRGITDELKAENKKGLLLILDDINGLAASETFANWIKSLVDEIATSEHRLPLCLLFVGLDERRQSLISLQPSLARIFNPVELNVWSTDETVNFFREAFGKVNVEVADSALCYMAECAGGFPVLAHEIGDAVFKVDRDMRIDKEDTFNGIRNAAENVGRKYLEPQVIQAIQGETYRIILGKVDQKPFGFEFQRGEVLKFLGQKEEKVFDNFLGRMSDLGAIKKNREKGRGWYQFVNLLTYYYFVLRAEQSK